MNTFPTPRPRQLPNNPSESVKRLNPHLFVAGLASSVREQDPVPALDCNTTAQPCSQESPRYRVVLVAFLANIFDDDNLAGGFKPLRDYVARSLGIDDGDPRIEWEYGQVRTRGRQGTVIKIEKL